MTYPARPPTGYAAATLVTPLSYGQLPGAAQVTGSRGQLDSHATAAGNSLSFGPELRASDPFFFRDQFVCTLFHLVSAFGVKASEFFGQGSHVMPGSGAG